VLEAGVEAPIQISVDERRRTTVPKREQAPIAASTPQHQMITDALEKVINAINQAEVSEQEKSEAKPLLRKLLSSKAAAKVLGAGAQSLAANYFKR
jgi:type II secretory pathway component PulL